MKVVIVLFSPSSYFLRLSRQVFSSELCFRVILTFWRRNYFLFILAHPVYKIWIIQETNTLELWNKLHFEVEKKTESIYYVWNI